MNASTINTTTIGNGNHGLVGTPIPGVAGWTYESAASMAKETSREDRLFGNRRNRSTRRAPRPEVSLMASDPARFTAETGWTPEDALAMALELRSERIHFGSHTLN
ncbi:MAG: hypothetical protein IAF58_17755 [Leptolyngbya sp.]|nr:hypothetical protein [Candidatus Melainabacteria bacterium]